MNNPFSQPKVIYKISCVIKYKDLVTFEQFFPEDILGISSYEIESSTIDSQENDLWGVEVFFAQQPDLSALINDLNHYSQENNLNFDGRLKLESIEDKDWVKLYQEQLKPIEIGSFFITSSSGKHICPPGKIEIFLEASRAFGTGDHPTTALCLRAVEFLGNQNIQNIIDIGTGSGILSFAAEKIWANSKIIACDIEEESVKIAKINSTYNNSNIYFYQNAVDELLIPRGFEQGFDLVMANILATPLINLSKTIKSIIHPKSKIILSGFLDYQVHDILEAYQNLGFKLENEWVEERWHTLLLK